MSVISARDNSSYTAGDGAGESASRYRRITTYDVDQTSAAIRGAFADARVSLEPGASAPYLMQVDLMQVGPLTIGDMVVPAALQCEVPQVDGYFVLLQLSGQWRRADRAHDVVASPGRAAAVVDPDRPAIIQHTAMSRTLQIKIEQGALENELAVLLDRPVRGPVSLGGQLDVRSGLGLSCARMIRLLFAEGRERESLISHPLYAENFWRAVIRGVLLAAPHRWQDELHSPVPAVRPRAIRRAIDAIEAEPQHPYTVHDLARIAGVSVRSLQDGFRAHVGMTPMAYLRRRRLGHCHAVLQAADPRTATVAAVANRWGFSHLGRFAQIYRAQFGVHPSTTLHKGRWPVT
jgi:AraC-like DNA-binding protein